MKVRTPLFFYYVELLLMSKLCMGVQKHELIGLLLTRKWLRYGLRYFGIEV